MKRALETSATADKHDAAQIQQVLKRVFRLKRLRSGQALINTVDAKTGY